MSKEMVKDTNEVGVDAVDSAGGVLNSSRFVTSLHVFGRIVTA